MKAFHLPVVILLMAALAGCKQQINLAAPYKEEPVIYGLLNQQDNPHYIRIEKGYLLNGNAYIAAGVADSIYYPNTLFVQITAQPSGIVYNLRRVNGDTLGLNKDTGIFATSPNILYAFSGALDANQNAYTIYDSNTVSHNVTTAQTALINNFYINTPIYGQEINLSNSEPFIVSWAAGQNAGVYDLTVRFYYQEFSSASNAILKDTFIDIPAFQSLIPGSASNSLTYTLSESGIVSFLSNNLTKTTSVYREFNIFKGMQFMFDAGGPALASFLTSQQAQNLSIASSDVLPPYTDITNGLGLFSSRYYTTVDSVGLTSKGLDSLACGSFSAGLRFKSSTGSICD